MSDVMHWISRYWRILVVLAGIVFWAGRLDMKVESLDGKVESLDGKVESLDERVGSLEEKVESLDQKVESLDEKVDLVLQILLDVDHSQEASKIAQESGAAD